ncbi:hypothetical protein [Deinococcus pimensis]|uniref:hypothetical protein n=1 Tax=Deinococcus pimensis TaxID=309888 RepID=UPI0004862AC6|nr:hypothetical protein [Deinococcus pimensis]
MTLAPAGPFRIRWFMDSHARAVSLIRRQRDELLDTLHVCETNLPPDLRALHADRLAFLAGLVRAHADDAVHLLHGATRVGGEDG